MLKPFLNQYLQVFDCVSVGVDLLGLSLNVRVNRLHLAKMSLVEFFEV